MDPILLSVMIVTSIGILGGIILVIASFFMQAPDETIEQILEVLPGANCGACGYAGCADYARGIVEDDELITECSPGGAEAAKQIAAILGADGGEVIPLCAVVACAGDCSQTKKRHDFQGEIKTCQAANEHYEGDGECAFGCLGYGDCVSTCSFHAITVVDGVAEIDSSRCTGCGACTKACPKSILNVKAMEDPKPYVACSNTDKGSETVKICKIGCIACQKCVKICPTKSIVMEQCVAVIDSESCIACKKCMMACPKGVILLPKESSS